MSPKNSDAANGNLTRPWPAARIELWPIERLIPYPQNARLHSRADIDQIAASVLRWGWTMPVLSDEQGNVIAGYARTLAALQLGLPLIPVIVARGWSEDERRAYRIADNQLAARASWDPERLGIELGALGTSGFDLGLIGFDPDQLEAILASSRPGGLTDPDAVPEESREPVSRHGDTWLMDAHRVVCGDSTAKEDVARVLAGAEPQLMVTDPPYGVDYDPSWRERRSLGVGQRSKGKVLNDDRADWHEAYALFPGDVAYVWHSALHGHEVAADLVACGLQLRAQIVWVKQHFALSRGHYHWRHEPCFYAVREGTSGHWAGDRKQTTVWEISNNNSFGNRQPERTWGHGTQKPVDCMRRPIVNNSRPGQAVYDPFLGSGTTVIAAEMTGRICYGLELNPAYADTIVQRWEAFTGRAASLEATSQSFAETRAARHHAANKRGTDVTEPICRN